MLEEIDQILTDFEDDNIGQPIAKEKLSQLFYTKMEEVLGEEDTKSEPVEKYPYITDWVAVRNDLRKEQRSKLSELVK